MPAKQSPSPHMLVRSICEVPISLPMAQQVIDLTRARWSDMPQQRGIVIELRSELGHKLPAVAGIESEIREALINLVFNAVDAMPDGGTLTVRTRTKGKPGTWLWKWWIRASAWTRKRDAVVWSHFSRRRASAVPGSDWRWCTV